MKRENLNPCCAACRALQRYCWLPDEVVSLEDYKRRSHTDIADREPDELRSELACLDFYLGIEPYPDPWFRDRRSRIRRALGHVS